MKRMATFFVIIVVLFGSAFAGAQNESKYSGSDNCLCHGDILKNWSKTPHSRSFELLVNVGQEKNAECLPCHTTGYTKGGFVDQATTPGLKGTACEACHGPGAEHMNNMGDKTKINRVPSGKVCGSCHQKTNIHAIN